MSDYHFHTSQSNIFSGHQTPYEKARYVVVGVPFDFTSSYRPGARFAPNAIREASANLETYSFRGGIDVEDLQIHDVGDLHVSQDVSKTLERVAFTVNRLVKAEKLPILIGGEHTLTLGAAQGASAENLAIIDFDAHLDLRDCYQDLTISHTTFLRRLNEELKPKKIVLIGSRAACREELTYAEGEGIELYSTRRIQEEGVRETGRAISKALSECEHTYLTVDMDVLDPAFAPGVQNPEPEGLTTQTLLDLIYGLVDTRLICADLVEVTPIYDNGTTAIQAAKTLFEILSAHAKAS
ncbi:MAG: agmatinase [Candidatus Bathyarchaeota archaeon]|nr:MAG: agmatinase [Candidatus Bathyarchaeota archaeon]